MTMAMRFWAARLVLILLPLTTTAARLHAHTIDAPDLAAQELNRCLKLVKIAASRRQRAEVLQRTDEGVAMCRDSGARGPLRR